jgi:CheY-like chemotaxis protein
MSDAVVTTLIRTAPSLLWVLFATTVFLVLRRPLVQQLSRLRAAALPFGTFDFDTALDLVERAAENQDQQAGEQLPGAGTPARADQRAVAARLEYAAGFLDRGRLLWVDDNPDNNAPLIAIFEQVGMSVHLALSTDSALTQLAAGRFDLVITDLARHADRQAGFDLAGRLAAQGFRLPVILFTLHFDPRQGVHPGIFAYTTSFDELIHLVIDVMERVRFEASDRRSIDHRPPALPRPGRSG